MAYRKLTNIKHKIEQATIKIGAKYGVHAVSARVVAAECDISTHTIYNNFSSMDSLIEYVATRFERRHMADAAKLVEEGDYSVHELFDVFLDKFVKDKRETLYYLSYTNENGFDPTLKNPRAAEFLQVARKLFKNEKLSDEMTLLLWDHATSMLFSYAHKIIKKYIPNDEVTRAEIKKIFFEGINALIESK